MTIIKIESPEHWHAIRAKHVGGSEIAAIFGECSYLTHLELYLIKRGEVSGAIEENERMFWGTVIEDAVAQGVAKYKGWVVSKPDVYYSSDEVEGMGCTPDRLIENPERPDAGLLQIKNVDRLVFMRWEDGAPPLQYQLQLQHELACTCLKWGALAVLVGGNDLKVFEFEAHAGVIAKIKAGVTKFWQDVRAGNQPPAVADDYEILKELYPADDHKVIDFTHDNEFPDLCAKAVEFAEKRKDAEKQERLAKSAILQKMGNAGRAICTGFKIKKTTVSKKEYLVSATTYQTLTIKPE